MLTTIARRIKQSTAVIVPETGRHCATPKQTDSSQHPLASVCQTLRNRDAIQTGENGGVQKQIEGVHVVIRGLLKMKTVGSNLPLGFLQNDLPAQLLPTFRSTQFWTHTPRKNKASAYGGRSTLKLRYNSVMARGDVVIANSQFTADAIARLYPLARGRLRVIPRGTDLKRFLARQRSSARASRGCARPGASRRTSA